MVNYRLKRIITVGNRDLQCSGLMCPPFLLGSRHNLVHCVGVGICDEVVLEATKGFMSGCTVWAQGVYRRSSLPRWRHNRLCCGLGSVSLTLVLIAHTSHSFSSNPNMTLF